VQAEGFRLFRATGVESEMEPAYAALHQLCLPMLVISTASPRLSVMHCASHSA